MSNPCQISTHDNQKIKYLCIDSVCTSQTKLGCADCFLESHASHRRLHTEEFIGSANTKISDLKANQTSSICNTIVELNQAIDQEFESCTNAIMQRFEKVRGAIKQSVEEDICAVQKKQDQLNQQIDRETVQMTQLINKPFIDLSDQQLLQLTQIYHDLPNLHNRHQQSIDSLRQERDLIKLKKQKHLRKLNQVVNSLLKELDPKTPEKDNDRERDLINCVTPEKKKSPSLINSQTKSPPTQIVEMVRSTKRTKITQQPYKKVSTKKKPNEEEL